MGSPDLTPGQLERYLAVLGVQPAPPSLAHLETLVRAHLVSVPFENVSKLLQRSSRERGLPSVDSWLEGIERYNFGGTCYASNPNLYRMLRACGYDADLCGAAMSAPDVHVVVVVRVDGRELLADVGYAAPFFAPLPLDSESELTVDFGRDRYALRPRGADGRSRLDQFRDGELIHGYTVDPTPRTLDHFAAVIADSYSDAACFMNSVVVVRFWRQRMVRLHNQTVVEAGPDRVTVRQLERRDQIPETVDSLFGIPAHLTAQAIRGIRDWADIYA